MKLVLRGVEKVVKLERIELKVAVAVAVEMELKIFRSVIGCDRGAAAAATGIFNVF